MIKKKVIITGSNGLIGTILKKALDDIYDIYSIDIHEESKLKYFCVDISDFKTVEKVFCTVKPDFVIHLAGQSKPNAGWEDILKNNIIATRNIYECSKLFNVEKIIFASSNHVTGGYEITSSKLYEEKNIKLITTNSPIRPDSYYAVSKIFGEALAKQFYEMFGLKSVCLRIGSVVRNDNPKDDKSSRCLKTWLSHRDLIQLIKKSLESSIDFGIYYGISDNSNALWSIENAKKELDYNPKDNAFVVL